MRRDERTARGASPEAIAVAVHGVGVGRHQLGDRQRLVRTGDVMVVDVTRPFDFAWSGQGSSTSLQVPIAELGLPLEAVQRAAPRLESSPLYEIVSHYLVDLTRDAEHLSAAPSAPALGEASVQLMRALLSGALEHPPGAHEVLEQTLLAQVRAYVRLHLRDPGLKLCRRRRCARGLAPASYFRICTSADFSLEQYVIGKRLEGAKAELVHPASQSRSIARVAFSWGFKDPTHFSRRFKAAYGMLPRDWRRQAHEETGAT